MMIEISDKTVRRIDAPRRFLMAGIEPACEKSENGSKAARVASIPRDGVVKSWQASVDPVMTDAKPFVAAVWWQTS